jgi:hypothetical protein
LTVISEEALFVLYFTFFLPLLDITGLKNKKKKKEESVVVVAPS